MIVNVLFITALCYKNKYPIGKCLQPKSDEGIISNIHQTLQLTQEGIPNVDNTANDNEAKVSKDLLASEYEMTEGVSQNNTLNIM